MIAFSWTHTGTHGAHTLGSCCLPRQVVEINGTRIQGAMRDTVLTPMGLCQSITICFDARELHAL
jgi:hypothetical protein